MAPYETAFLRFFRNCFSVNIFNFNDLSLKTIKKKKKKCYIFKLLIKTIFFTFYRKKKLNKH